ncbi:hypothetical protein LDENG_00185810 [Lucifuga dentata]|nr:hypothetical protein LDENG_00185810 [Lucifuga dentata]
MCEEACACPCTLCKIQTLRMCHSVHDDSFLKDHTTDFVFEPNMLNFHTCYITDNHFPKDKTVFKFS